MRKAVRQTKALTHDIGAIPASLHMGVAIGPVALPVDLCVLETFRLSTLAPQDNHPENRHHQANMAMVLAMGPIPATTAETPTPRATCPPKAKIDLRP